jgi:hypothetical protein
VGALQGALRGLLGHGNLVGPDDLFEYGSLGVIGKPALDSV